MEISEIKKELEGLGFQQSGKALRLGDVYVNFYSDKVKIHNTIHRKDLYILEPTRQNIRDLAMVFQKPLNAEEYMANHWDMFLRDLYLHKGSLKGFNIVGIKTYEHVIISNGDILIWICCDMVKGSPYVVYHGQKEPGGLSCLNEFIDGLKK